MTSVRKNVVKFTRGLSRPTAPRPKSARMVSTALMHCTDDSTSMENGRLPCSSRCRFTASGA
ncbi:hypothetical protein D3C87_2133300 [compost metagenome]